MQQLEPGLLLNARRNDLLATYQTREGGGGGGKERKGDFQ